MKIFKMLLLKDYVTLGNCVCGTLSICFSIIGLFSPRTEPWGFWVAAIFIYFGMMFDLADGWVARRLNQANEIGIQIDSLSDVITFAVAPAIFCFTYFGIYWNTWGMTDPRYFMHLGFVLAGSLVFVACGVIRLAWFNVEEPEGYQGLPTPMTALLVLLLYYNDVFNRYHIIAGSEIAPIYAAGLYNFFLFFNLPTTICILLIFFGFCNITDYIRFGQGIRKKTGIIIPLIIIVSILGIFFAMLDWVIFLLINQPGLLPVQLKFPSMLTHILLFVFFCAGFGLIGYGVKTYLGVRKEKKSSSG